MHFHVFGIAIVDLIFTILGAYIIYKILKHYKYKVNFLTILIFLLVLGIVFHKIFCVDTTLNKMLFK